MQSLEKSRAGLMEGLPGDVNAEAFISAWAGSAVATVQPIRGEP